MATRSYRPGTWAEISDGSEVLGEHAFKIATEQLIPRIAKRNQKAVETIPFYIYFFPAIRAGRRCSCFDVEDSQDTQCLACFGTGVVGGYEKYGTTLEIIDVTKPNIRTTNITPDWSKRRKPIPLALIAGARQGSIEARIELTSNIGEVDALASDVLTDPGSTISAYVRCPSDQEYMPLTSANIKQRLHNPWIDVKIVLERQSPTNPSPLFRSLYLRYKNFSNNKIKTDIPRLPKSIVLQELGVVDDWQGMKFWLDNSLKAITTNDFFASVEGNSRWALRTVNDFAPHGQLVSWDVEGRLVQDPEPIMKIPL